MKPEVSDRLAEAIENLTQRLQVIDDTLTDIHHELHWLMRNREDPYVIKNMPLDPASKTWAVDLAEMNSSAGAETLTSDSAPAPTVQSKLSESTTVACDVCDREVSPEEAKREKWTDVARWKGGGHAAFLGICPGCISGEPAKPKPAKAKTLFPTAE